MREGEFSSAKARMDCKPELYLYHSAAEPTWLSDLPQHHIYWLHYVLFFNSKALASPYLHRDEASQLQMSLHHGETSKKISALWAEVGKLPSQESKS